MRGPVLPALSLGALVQVAPQGACPPSIVFFQVSGLLRMTSTVSTRQSSPTELSRPFDMDLPAVCKHRKVLEDAGLIVRRSDGKWRPRRLEPVPLHQVADWVQHYRQFWEYDFDHPHELRKVDLEQEKHRHK